MKKLLLIGAGVIVVAAGSWGLWKWRQPAAPSAATAVTAKVERGDIRVVVASAGRVVANQEVDVKCKAGGQITKMPFDISDVVHTGDLLVELDQIDEQRNVKGAEVQLAAANAKLASARESLAISELTLKTDRQRSAAALKAAESHAVDAAQKAERMRQLLLQKLVSQEESDTTDTQTIQATADLDAARIHTAELETQTRALELKRQDVALAQATVDNDQIALDIAKDRLRDTRVLSPIDGVVAARQVQPGQIISSATSNVGGGTTLLTLSDLSRVFVFASVDETDIGKVDVGQKANVTVDAFPGRRFPGEVVRLAVRGVNSSNVVTFDVQIEVTGPEKKLLKPEMTANVEIVTAHKAGVLTLPLEAAVRKRGQYFVDKVTDGMITATPVTVGLTQADRLEITSGLAEGDTVSYVKGGDGAGKWSAQTRAPGGMMMGMGGAPRGGR